MIIDSRLCLLFGNSELNSNFTKKQQVPLRYLYILDCRLTTQHSKLCYYLKNTSRKVQNANSWHLQHFCQSKHVVKGGKGVTLFMHFNHCAKWGSFQRVQVGSSEQIKAKFCIRRDVACGWQEPFWWVLVGSMVKLKLVKKDGGLKRNSKWS